MKTRLLCVCIEAQSHERPVILTLDEVNGKDPDAARVTHTDRSFRPQSPPLLPVASQ